MTMPSHPGLYAGDYDPIFARIPLLPTAWAGNTAMPCPRPQVRDPSSQTLAVRPRDAVHATGCARKRQDVRWCP